MADGAVRIHSDDGLAPLGISGVHLSKGVSLGETIVSFFACSRLKCN